MRGVPMKRVDSLMFNCSEFWNC